MEGEGAHSWVNVESARGLMAMSRTAIMPPMETLPTGAPQQVRNMKWLLESTQRHRYSLTRPPVLAAYVLLALAAYSRGRFDTAALPAVKNERIAFQADQLAAYRERLNGATPDQAAKMMAELQERVDGAEQLLRPTKFRKLSDAEKAKLRERQDELRSFGHPLFVYAGALGDSPYYASDFIQFFKSIKVDAIGVETRCQPSLHEGVMVGMKDPKAPSDHARVFIDILAAAGLRPSTTLWHDPPEQGLDFDLFICPQERSSK